jgi:hypothetical protein
MKAQPWGRRWVPGESSFGPQVLADELFLDDRQPHVIRPLVGVDRVVMAALQ